VGAKYTAWHAIPNPNRGRDQPLLIIVAGLLLQRLPAY
jgi:hypothetical protein